MQFSSQKLHSAPFGTCKGKVNMYSSYATTSPLMELLCHMGSWCYLSPSWVRWHSCLYPSQLKLVLYSATSEECKA